MPNKSIFAAQESKSSGINLASVLLISVLSFGGYFLYSRNKTQTTANEEAQKLLDKPTQWASRINYFLGNMIQMPNVPELVAIAREITDWPGVVIAYKNLYNSNIEEDIKTKLQIFGGYQDFLTALSKRGLPGTNTGNILVEPKKTVVQKGQKLLLDNSKYPVTYFRDWREYPVKPLASVPIGKLDPKKKSVTFLQALDATYAGSTVKVSLYQISLSNGQVVWVNRDKNIVKKTGTAGLIGTEKYLEVA